MMIGKTNICLLVGLGVFVSVGQAAVPQVPYSRTEALKKFVRPSSVPQPKANPSTPERENLGKLLFFDPRLSGANSISCASCHNPSFSWSDGLPKGIGHGSKPVGRHTPTILNTAYAELLFWDGRAESLEEQALGPIGAPGEMNMPLTDLPAKLAKIPGYKELFEKAYPGEGVTEKTIAKAIASFERTIVSSKAPFDHWVEGKEEAITPAAKRGFDLFNNKAGCVQCHSGWNFSDDGFHDIGLTSDDIGRGKYLKEIEIVQHAFKTPTLRNITRRAPYMHDGSEATLEGTVLLYNQGGKVKRPSLAQEIHPLGLTQDEVHDVCEFMKTLTSNDKPLEMPTLPN